MLLVIVLIFSVIIVIIDYIPLIKRKNKRDTAVYSFVFFISVTVLIMYSLDIDIPSLSPLIEKALMKISGQK
ncbi:MAG: hypothetical protein WC900_00470 [Oscillospiraceae bacterium]|jgi:hypothetical protein